MNTLGCGISKQVGTMNRKYRNNGFRVMNVLFVDFKDDE